MEGRNQRKEAREERKKERKEGRKQGYKWKEGSEVKEVCEWKEVRKEGNEGSAGGKRRV